ncbi:hypothetical protein LCGC14_1080830 [marine sediment metagenome]|uniref:Uncharacterized protein n=1 Tax=marine sediment metagenome TaxID=412755 RepID=A0A0F9PYG7_9ZZZZ
MPYTSFLIADLKTAKSIGKEPWLSPQDAFETFENMRTNKGVLEKRLGFSPYAQMKHSNTAKTDTNITGIHQYVNRGMPSLLIMDGKRCNYYNPIDQTMTDISSDLDTPADIFSGSASDFFSFENWLGVGYMVNNVDQIHKWEGRETAVVPFNYRFDGSNDDTNQLNTCRFLFVKDDRLLFLDTTEFGNWLPNRLRYTPVLQIDGTQPGGGHVDAPTQLRIVAAGFVGKHIAVFMQGGDEGSLWLIKSTGNADIPFRWDRVTGTELVRSPYSGIETRIGVRDGLVAVGTTNIIFYDGFQITNIDMPNLRDILSEFNDSVIRSVFGYGEEIKERRHLLFTFADSSSSVPDRILDYNQTENNWTIHKSEQSFFVNTIGGFNDQKVPTMIELDDVITSDGDTVSNMNVDSRAVLGTPSPITLIGCRNSRVYKWLDGEFDGTDDANGVIAINATSSRFNPFAKNGRKVSCEKIGFLVDNDASASFTVSVFKNTGSVAYKTKVISCDSEDDTVDKFWVFIFCNGEEGDFHRFKISHTERGNTPKIHAYMLYFQSAGRLTA